MNNKPLSKQGGRNKRKKKKEIRINAPPPFSTQSERSSGNNEMKIRECWEDEKKGEDEKKEENDEPVPVLTNFSFVGMICGGEKKKKWEEFA